MAGLTKLAVRYLTITLNGSAQRITTDTDITTTNFTIQYETKITPAGTDILYIAGRIPTRGTTPAAPTPGTANAIASLAPGERYSPTLADKENNAGLKYQLSEFYVLGPSGQHAYVSWLDLDSTE